MIVVIAHVKGGTGKTTTAFQVALRRQISMPERKIWLIDADEQQSALDTISIRDEQGLSPAIACAAYSSASALKSQINAQAQAGLWDDVIIDCGGRDSDALRVALLAADKLVVPVLPGAYDVWALTRLAQLVSAAKSLGSKVKSLAFINRLDKSSECREAISFLQESEDFSLMKASLTMRRAYAKACGQGRAVSEMRPADKTAIAEIEALTAEIFEDV